MKEMDIFEEDFASEEWIEKKKAREENPQNPVFSLSYLQQNITQLHGLIEENKKYHSKLQDEFKTLEEKKALLREKGFQLKEDPKD